MAQPADSSNTPKNSLVTPLLSREIASYYENITVSQILVEASPSLRSDVTSMPVQRFKVGDTITWGTGAENFTVVGYTTDSYRLRDATTGQTASVAFAYMHAITTAAKLVTAPNSTKKQIKKKPVVTFDSVIISDDKRQQIIEALEQINQSELIFDIWGFGNTIEKGKGVSLLFYGPPGTGKTLMAQAIAHKHKTKLKVISTADVESSAPGEAERNIRKHFEDAAKDKSVLLFDECDSLIYSRSNSGPIMAAQVNELLSQIERFDGITIFTTNRLGTLDEAVNRRLALKLEFAMPSASERAEIWQRMIPKKAPIADDVDWLELAGIEIVGGYIKNTVLRAARMAAVEPIPDKQKKLRREHFIRALRQEVGSMLEFEAAKQADELLYAMTRPDGSSVSGQHVTRSGGSLEAQNGHL